MHSEVMLGSDGYIDFSPLDFMMGFSILKSYAPFPFLLISFYINLYKGLERSSHSLFQLGLCLFVQQISGALVNDENAEVVHHDQLQSNEAEEEEVGRRRTRRRFS